MSRAKVVTDTLALARRDGDTARPPYLIAHIIHRLDVGGLENGLINLVNCLDRYRFRHAIICMTDYTDFSLRISNPNVSLYSMQKRSGQDLGLYLRLWRLLRAMRPDLVHTRNIGTMECLVPAALAGVRLRVHGEHGRDAADMDGSNRRYLRLRQLLNPFVSRYVALSKDLEGWLRTRVGISPKKITQIYNGVDLERFGSDKAHDDTHLPDAWGTQRIVFGTVGRMRAEKDQLTLVRAFARALTTLPMPRTAVGLVLVGDGPFEERIAAEVRDQGLDDCVWLAGSRDDIPDILRELDVFVLPSLGEGISNTILEAMASSLPVIATRVGGNAELVDDGHTGLLVPASDVDAMAHAIATYARDATLRQRHGTAARKRVNSYFSLATMVNGYSELYDGLINQYVQRT